MLLSLLIFNMFYGYTVNCLFQVYLYIIVSIKNCVVYWFIILTLEIVCFLLFLSMLLKLKAKKIKKTPILLLPESN